MTPKWLKRLIETGVSDVAISKNTFLEKTFEQCVREVEDRKRRKKIKPTSIKRRKKLKRSRRRHRTFIEDRLLQQLTERRKALVSLLRGVGRRLYAVEQAITSHYSVHILGQHVVVTEEDSTRTTYAVVGISYRDTPPYYVLWCRKRLDTSTYSAEVYLLKRPDGLVGIDARDDEDTTDRLLLRHHDLARFRKGFRFPSMYAQSPIPHQVAEGKTIFLYPPSEEDCADLAYDHNAVYPRLVTSPRSDTPFEPSVVDGWIIERVRESGSPKVGPEYLNLKI
jgi:hypothetical protein